MIPIRGEGLRLHSLSAPRRIDSNWVLRQGPPAGWEPGVTSVRERRWSPGSGAPASPGAVTCSLAGACASPARSVQATHVSAPPQAPVTTCKQLETKPQHKPPHNSPKSDEFRGSSGHLAWHATPKPAPPLCKASLKHRLPHFVLCHRNTDLKENVMWDTLGQVLPTEPKWQTSLWPGDGESEALKWCEVATGLFKTNSATFTAKQTNPEGRVGDEVRTSCPNTSLCDWSLRQNCYTSREGGVIFLSSSERWFHASGSKESLCVDNLNADASRNDWRQRSGKWSFIATPVDHAAKRIIVSLGIRKSKFWQLWLPPLKWVQFRSPPWGLSCSS